MTQEPDIKCWTAKRKAELIKQIYRGRTTVPEATVTVKVSVAFECFYAALCRASIVSHSLGGGMASAASQASGKTATTYNASGLHKKTVARYGGTVQDSTITAYRVKDELLTGLQEPGWKSHAAGFALGGLPGLAAVFGLGKLMPNAVGEHIQTPKISMNPIQGHSMDDVLASFRQLIDEDEQALAKSTDHTCAWAS